jgi:hypothetical protein
MSAREHERPGVDGTVQYLGQALYSTPRHIFVTAFVVGSGDSVRVYPQITIRVCIKMCLSVWQGENKTVDIPTYLGLHDRLDTVGHN